MMPSTVNGELVSTIKFAVPPVRLMLPVEVMLIGAVPMAYSKEPSFIINDSSNASAAPALNTSAAPFFTVVVPAVVPKPELLLVCNEPASTLTLPLKVFVAVILSCPPPAFTRSPAPETILENEPELVTSTVFGLLPLMVPLLRLMRPVNSAVVPLMRILPLFMVMALAIGSGTRSVEMKLPLVSNVAPLPIVVADKPLPNALALVILRVPPLMLVAPL